MSRALVLQTFHIFDFHYMTTKIYNNSTHDHYSYKTFFSLCGKKHGGDTLHLFFIWGNQYIIISNTSSK